MRIRRALYSTKHRILRHRRIVCLEIKLTRHFYELSFYLTLLRQVKFLDGSNGAELVNFAYLALGRMTSFAPSNRYFEN